MATALKNGFNQYKASETTASQPNLILMLYNGLLKFLQLSIKAIEDNDIEAAHNNITRCEDIVLEFQVSLNMDYEISGSLRILYDFIYNRLVEANTKKDRAILEEIVPFVTELRDTWSQAMLLAKDENAKVNQELNGAMPESIENKEEINPQPSQPLITKAAEKPKPPVNKFVSQYSAYANKDSKVSGNK